VAVVGPVRLHRIGAAANTANFLNTFGFIGCPAAKPPTPKFNPNAPMVAELATPIKQELVSLNGQK
jgi:hypothetical protein